MDSVDNIKGIPGKAISYCTKNHITTVPEAFNAYIKEFGINKGVEEFYKNFKCLYILELSEKFTELPTPIKIEYENKESRSSSGNLQNS